MRTALKRNSFLLYILASVLLTGCGGSFPFAHQPQVEQGNILEPEQVERIRVGMTRDEVRRILGTPMLEHPFHAERWDYIYTTHGGRKEAVRQRLTLHFENDTVARIVEHPDEGR